MMKKHWLCILILMVVSACEKEPAGPEASSGSDWITATPASQGLDADRLAAAVQAARQRSHIKCLLIVRNGVLVLEEYFHGFDQNDYHVIHSISKSFISALVGIALEWEILDDLSQKCLDFFPQYDRETLDGRKRKITLEHLMTMRAGFDTDHNVYSQIYNSANWVRSTLELPLVSNPGEKFIYNTFETHLLSAVLTKAASMSTYAFAQQVLFNPLGITCDHWQKDPQGIYFGGNNMYFNPRELAWFGFLYLQDGKIDERQLIPRSWINASWTPSYSSSSSWGDLDHVGYGYLWWLGEIRGHDVRIALGYGGQFIVIFPDLKMIVVINSFSEVDWDQADLQERQALNVIADYILPALIND